jgi:spermidine synthase
LAFFFLSGACGLVYEVVWMRMLTLVFGATAFATSTILASFFAGLALGSFYFGRVIDKGRNPLLIYALLEAGIGISAFLMPLLFSGLTKIYVGISQHYAISYYQISLLRFALSFLVMLVPATLMGGTLPVIVKFFARRRERLAWNVGHLYSLNTFGAVVGTVSAGFFLILMLGVKESAYVAGVVNLLIAGTVLALAWRSGIRQVASSDAIKSIKEPEESRGEVFSSKLALLALWAVGVSGFCALAVEVFWTRALVFFLDNSTHAFTTILTAFLLGIAIGSFIVARFIDTRKKLLAWLGLIEVLIGLSAILAIPILSNLTPVFQSMAGSSLDSMLHWKWIGMRFVKSLMVVLVPTVLMGMTFPLVSKIYTRNVNVVGRALGDVYSVNTIGGVFGSLIAGFVLIPSLGVQNGIMLIAGINVILGGVLILSEPLMKYETRMKMVVGLGLLLIGVGTFYVTHGPTTLTSYYEGIEGPEVLSYEEGIGGTVKVYRDKWGDKVLSINGFPVAGTGLEPQDAQKALAHLPLLLSNAPSPRVNIVGFGAGGTSWGVMQYNVQEVDCVELVPGVLDAAIWFPEINHGVLSDPTFNLIMGDGRNYALVTDKEYDVITIDATSPKMAGNGSLYTLEFYELLEERLSSDGLLVQWVPLHLLSDQEVRMIAKTFITVFPHTTLWFTPLRQYFILVGTRGKLEIDFGSLSAKLEMRNVQRDLELLNVTDPIDVLGWFAMGEEALAKYVGDATINTDNHPYLEFTPAMAYFASGRYRVENTLTIRELRESVLPFLVNVGETEEEIAAVAEKVQKRFEATYHSIRGDMLDFLGMREQALVEYNTALLIDPQEKNWLHPIWRDAGPRR